MVAGQEQYNDIMKFEKSRQFANRLDSLDKLAKFQQWFLYPETDGIKSVYFLGNSLGLQPVSVRLALAKVLQQWADLGVESFFKGKEPWLEFHDQLTGKLGVIIGANPNEISIMNQLTVNIHLMLASFYRPVGKRKKIIIEAKAFPSDQYALDSFIKLLGLDPKEILIEVVATREDQCIDDDEIVSMIKTHGDELAMIFLGGVNYYTGQVFDIKKITAAAHSVGAVAGYDLAHAVGNVQLDLHNWDVDFACWCSYKYLNAGPGAMGAVFINQRFHSDDSINKLAGWWGNKIENRFNMHRQFDAADNATAWQLSTPSMLLYACLKASLSIFEHAGWHNLLEKQDLMKQWLAFLINDVTQSISSHSVKCLTPSSRGCQISLYFSKDGKIVFDRLTEKGFMVDWREPGVIRLAPVPLYNTFTEIWDFYETLKDVLYDLNHINHE